jgi:hypothetical protein
VDHLFQSDKNYSAEDFLFWGGFEYRERFTSERAKANNEKEPLKAFCNRKGLRLSSTPNCPSVVVVVGAD